MSIFKLTYNLIYFDWNRTIQINANKNNVIANRTADRIIYYILSLNGSTDKYGHYSSPFANRSSYSYICSRKNSVRFLNSQDVNKGNCRVEFLKSADYDPRYTKNQQGQTHKKWPLSLFALFLH